MPRGVPMAVLSQQLSEVIGGRRIRSAVFTTFTFDPGFFELNVLPVLFDQTFSQVDKVRRIQLEDALRSLDHLAVYYDRRALAQEGEPAHLDYRRIDIGRSTGAFHPKLILLLVDELLDEEDDPKETVPYQSLVVGVLSANLTRSGWWENVECVHFEEIHDRDFDESRCSFRPDLVTLLRRVRESAQPDEDQSALLKVREFLLRRTQRKRFTNVSSATRFYTKIFLGQNRSNFSQWLSDLRLDVRDWNLEIVSPFFDPHGAGPLEEIINTIQPRQTRVYLPRREDGSADVTQATYDAVEEYATWSDLPREVTRRGRDQVAERLAPRRVHAKVYRLWNGRGRDLLIVGSVNLTGAAHSHAAAGNLEAAYLIDVTGQGYPRQWWLTPIADPARRFVDTASAEDDGLPQVPLNVSLRYDWVSGDLAYRLLERSDSPFEIAETSGVGLVSIENPRKGNWIRCPRQDAARVRQALLSSSFLLIKHPQGQWRVLVREENMSHRPSLLTQLTPEEILEYWALLSPEQRAAFIEVRVGSEVSLEGLPITLPERLQSRKTLFDRFAGIYHSFGCLGRHVEDAIYEERFAEAESRIFGRKYDSLTCLLEKTLERTTGDPITRYVTFLSARQLLDRVRSTHPEFMSFCRGRTEPLLKLLSQLDEVRGGVGLSESGEGRDFLDWYEKAFLRELRREVRTP